MPTGALLVDACALLRELGVAPGLHPGSFERRLQLEVGGNEVITVRPTDVPVYVEMGACDCGIVGKDVLWECRSVELYELADLRFGVCRLVLAAPEGSELAGGSWPSSLRVATKYPQAARRFFAGRGGGAELIRLHGSVELAPSAGLSDGIVDLVATGATLRANRLCEVATIATSTARLVVNVASMKTRGAAITELATTLRRTVERGRVVIALRVLTRRAVAGGRGSPAPQRRFEHRPGDRPPCDAVREIVADVRRRGDAAVVEWTERLDGARVDVARADPAWMARCWDELDHAAARGAHRRRRSDPRLPRPAGGRPPAGRAAPVPAARASPSRRLLRARRARRVPEHGADERHPRPGGRGRVDRRHQPAHARGDRAPSGRARPPTSSASPRSMPWEERRRSQLSPTARRRSRRSTRWWARATSS